MTDEADPDRNWRCKNCGSTRWENPPLLSRVAGIRTVCYNCHWGARERPLFGLPYDPEREEQKLIDELRTEVRNLEGERDRLKAIVDQMIEKTG
jgi:hypothetical protein